MYGATRLERVQEREESSRDARGQLCEPLSGLAHVHGGSDRGLGRPLARHGRSQSRSEPVLDDTGERAEGHVAMSSDIWN